jgi:hypothetical protein
MTAMHLELLITSRIFEKLAPPGIIRVQGGRQLMKKPEEKNLVTLPFQTHGSSEATLEKRCVLQQKCARAFIVSPLFINITGEIFIVFSVVSLILLCVISQCQRWEEGMTAMDFPRRSRRNRSG